VPSPLSGWSVQFKFKLTFTYITPFQIHMPKSTKDVHATAEIYITLRDEAYMSIKNRKKAMENEESRTRE